MGIVGVARVLPDRPNAGQRTSGDGDFCLDVFALLNPGGRETSLTQHPMGHAPVRIFEGVLGEVERFALAREIVEFSLCHGFANFSID